MFDCCVCIRCASHCQDCENSVSKIRSSVLNLVDLAGSERQRDTQTVGVRLKVSGYDVM